MKLQSENDVIKMRRSCERSLQGLEVAVDSIYLYYNMQPFHVEFTH